MAYHTNKCVLYRRDPDFWGPDFWGPSPVTSHGRLAAQRCASKISSLYSQCVDLGLLSITAAFRAARDLKKILGSGFEMIRISQCESPRVFRVYDQAIKFRITIEESFGVIQKLLVTGFEARTRTGNPFFSDSAHLQHRNLRLCPPVLLPSNQIPYRRQHGHSSALRLH